MGRKPRIDTKKGYGWLDNPSAPVAWQDTCPICKQKCIKWCKCMKSERICPGGHMWVWKDDQKIILNQVDERCMT